MVLRLHFDPGDRRRRQAVLERRPRGAVVHRVEEPVSGSRKQHAAAIRVLGDVEDVVQRVPLRQATADLRPRLSVVRRPVDERVAVVHQVIVHRHVRGTRVETRGLDTPDGAPLGQSGDVLRHVVPRAPAVERVPDQSVVGPGPDEAAPDLRRGNGEHDLAVELPEVIADDAAGRDDAAGVLRRQVGTDDAPGLALIAGLEDDLAAVIHRFRLERVEGQRW